VDRLSDFKLGTRDELKRMGLHGVGLLHVAMHSQLPRFLVYSFTFLRILVQTDSAAASHEMYTRASVISTITQKYRDISPTSPRIFTVGVVKSAIFGLIAQQH